MEGENQHTKIILTAVLIPHGMCPHARRAHTQTTQTHTGAHTGAHTDDLKTGKGYAFRTQRNVC